MVNKASKNHQKMKNKAKKAGSSGGGVFLRLQIFSWHKSCQKAFNKTTNHEVQEPKRTLEIIQRTE
jgi:hypothetical protein